MDSEYLNSGPHACVASTFATESSPQDTVYFCHQTWRGLFAFLFLRTCGHDEYKLKTIEDESMDPATPPVAVLDEGNI